MKFNLTFLASIFLALTLVQSCQDAILKTGNEDNFNQLYKEFTSKNHAEYDTLIAFFRKVDSSYKLNQTKKLLFLLKTTEARIYHLKNENKKSNTIFKQANRTIINTKNSDTLIAINYIGIGINYSNMSIFDSAFFYFNKAKKIYEKSGSNLALQVVENNLARAYFNKGDMEKATEILKEIRKNPQSISIELQANHIMANIFGMGGQIDSAMAIDRKMIAKHGHTTNNYGISSLYNNLADCYAFTNQLDSALFYCKKSYLIDSIAGIKVNMGANLVTLSEIHFHKNQKDSSYFYLSKALEIFSDAANIDNKYRIFQILKERAMGEQNYPLALTYQDSVLSTYKKMNNTKTDQTIELLKIEYETEKKNQLIANQNLKLTRQRLIFLSIAIFLGLSAILIYLFFKQKERKNLLHIAQREAKLADMLIDAEQNERSRISRELHDSVSQKLSFIQMQVSMLKAQSSEIANSVYTMVNEVSTEVRSISHNLFPSDLNKGIVAAIEHLCEQQNFLSKDLKFQFNIDDETKNISLNKNLEIVLFRIIQELANNAIKYSGAKNLVISLSKSHNQILLTVADDGKGFDTSKIESGEGIGLKNISNRLERIDGKLKVESAPGSGTKFIIETPTY